MTITNKDSILKKYYEANGQESMFGYDNLEFKTINHQVNINYKDLLNDLKNSKYPSSSASLASLAIAS